MATNVKPQGPTEIPGAESTRALTATAKLPPATVSIVSKEAAIAVARSRHTRCVLIISPFVGTHFNDGRHRAVAHSPVEDTGQRCTPRRGENVVGTHARRVAMLISARDRQRPALADQYRELSVVRGS